MAFAFSRQRLDVSSKTRSNLFNWRGQFTPEFVEYLLEHFSTSGSTVVDPFSGSGTVLSEASKRDVSAVGFEINPSAYAMSKFWTLSKLRHDERQDLVEEVEGALTTTLHAAGSLPVYVDHPDYRVAFASLLQVGKDLFPQLGRYERILLANLLFLSERDKRSYLRDSLMKSFRSVSEALLSLPSNQGIDAFLDDARNIGNRIPSKADLILTSPPYINVFNYHQNYRAIVEQLGFDILTVANSEFGSNRKNRGNRFRTVVQYALDIEEAAISMWHALKSDGYLIMVLGRESNVRGVPFFNGKIVREILNGTGGFKELDILERQFVNKFGKTIKEDILVFSRQDTGTMRKIGRSIAKQHLEKALSYATKEVRGDVENALLQSSFILPSPIFSSQEVMKDA